MADITGYKVLVTKTGTEKEFVSELINTITGLSNKITCSGSVDQYDSGDTSTIPEFTFSINGKETLKIKRSAALSNNSGCFYVSIFVDNNYMSQNKHCYYSQGDYAASFITTRSYYISWIVSRDFILLSLHTSVEASGYGKNHVVINAKHEDSYYGTGYFKDGTYLSRNELFQIETDKSNNQSLIFHDFDSGLNGTFSSRFSFISKPGTIDYIKSSAYVSSGYKVFDIPDIYDCTTVNIGDTVSLKDGAYLAVGTNQLVKVS